MDMATALGVMGLGLGALSIVLGALSIVLGFLVVRQGRRTDQVLAAEADKTRNVIAEMRESAQEIMKGTQALIASEGDKTRNLVSELHESTKAFIAALSTEHAEILRRFPAR